MNTSAAPSPTPPTRRAHKLRRLQTFHVNARRWLSESGADYTTLCELEALVARLRTQLWRGVL